MYREVCMFYRKLFLMLASFLLVFAFSFSAYAENVIKLGSAISFTGAKSRTGKLYVDSYKFAVNKVNEMGGVNVNGKNYKFELVFYDDKSEPTESARLVEKLITVDKVDFLLGPYSSGITIPNSIVARRYRIPMIEAGGASSKIFNKGNEYIFGMLPRAEDYFRSTLEFLTEQDPKPNKIAILYADDKFDVSVGEGAKAAAEEMGFDVVVYEKYSEGASDFTSAITKAKDAGAEATLVAGHTEEAINFVQQSKELDYSPNLLGLTVGPSEADFRKALGKDANYIYGVASWSTEMNFEGYLFEDTQTFVKKFTDKFGYDPDYHNAAGIAAIAVYKDAIERAGSLDPQKIRDAIAETSGLKTIYGPVDFMDNGQIIGSSVVLQILDGKVRQVYPASGYDAVYPMPEWDNR